MLVGVTWKANRLMDCVKCIWLSFVRCAAAALRTLALLAPSSGIGSGCQALTLEMSRGGGCRARTLFFAFLLNLGLGIESWMTCVVAMPSSLTLTTVWLFAAYVTWASCAKLCCVSLAALFMSAMACGVRAWKEAASLASLSTSLFAFQSTAGR